MTVTALLVSHDGARWLPAVLAGLGAQRRTPDRVLALDTGSRDDSVELLGEALGQAAVQVVPGSFPDAVRHAVDQIDTEWVWLLHDDVNPDPGALAALLATAEETSADIVGPKIREWPSLRRLLEVGVTVSGSGRRETGLERGEYDQGQHDAPREVLAVNTAGMLVRRSVLARLGLEPALPVFGSDLDLGWRAARAGLRTMVAPEAVVFHAEASTHGLRGGGRARGHQHRDQRRAALWTVLANTRGPRVVWAWLRLLVGSVLRAFGFLLARSPWLAVEELAATRVLFGLGRLRAARRARSELGTEHEDRVRRLLAPWWLPLRHGLDYLGDVAVAVLNQGRDVAERRRSARSAETGPVADEADELEADSGWLARWVTSPLALGLTVLFVVSLWAARDAYGAVAGGALAPAPDDAGDLWRLATEGWHRVGQGTDAPAPAYLLPLATLGTVLLGSATAAVSALFLLGAPIAAWGAWRFGRALVPRVTGRRAAVLPLLWASLTYASLPLASGAWGQGRFGVLAAAVLLPWLAHAALGFGSGSADRRWRAGWRSGLLLAVITAFTPTAWLVAVVLVALAAGGLVALGGRTGRSRSVWGPLIIVVLVPPVLLLPGAVGMLDHDLSGLLLEAGLVMPQPSGLELVAGRFPDPAAPVWLGLLLLVPAVVALLRSSVRFAVLGCWMVVAATAVVAAVLSRVEVDVPAGTTTPGLGFALLLLGAGMVTAVLLAAPDAGLRGWRNPVAAVAAIAAVLVPVGGLGWWLVGDNLLHEPTPGAVPAYLRVAAAEDPDTGVLLVRGDVEHGMRWSVYRGDGPTLGEEEILALSEPDPALVDDVRALLTEPSADLMDRFPDHGLDHLVMPAPADPDVAATLDAASGLSRASTADRDTRAWQFDQGVSDGAVDGEGSAWHGLLVALQLVAFVVVLVLCGPARKEGR